MFSHMFFTLRGVTMTKVLWGRNKKPKFGNDVNLEIKFLPYVFFVQALHTPRAKNSSGVYRRNYNHLRTSRLSRSAHVPDPGQVQNGYGRARAPPEDLFHSFKPCRRQKQNKRWRVCHRKLKTLATAVWK